MLVSKDIEKDGLLEDIFCFIKNKIDDTDLEKSHIYFMLYALDTILYDFSPPLDKQRIFNFVDSLPQYLQQRREGNKTFFIYSDLTKAILSSFSIFKNDPEDVFQEIYLFTDGDFSSPGNRLNKYDFADLYKDLEQYDLSTQNLRNFYYYPLFTKTDQKITKIIDDEGGAVFTNVEKKLCQETIYIYATLSVVDHDKNPFPYANIITNQTRIIHKTDENGILLLKAKTILPTLVQFKVGYTGFDDNYTNIVLNNDDTTYFKLEPVRLIKAPLRFYLRFFDEDLEIDENKLNGCNLTIDNFDRKHFYQLNFPEEEIVFFDHHIGLDSLIFQIDRYHYQPQDSVIQLGKWKNNYKIDFYLKKEEE